MIIVYFKYMLQTCNKNPNVYPKYFQRNECRKVLHAHWPFPYNCLMRNERFNVSTQGIVSIVKIISKDSFVIYSMQILPFYYFYVPCTYGEKMRIFTCIPTALMYTQVSLRIYHTFIISIILIWYKALSNNSIRQKNIFGKFYIFEKLMILTLSINLQK